MALSNPLPTCPLRETERTWLTPGTGFRSCSDSLCPLVSDGLDNTSPRRLKQNSKHHEIRCEKHQKCRNANEQQRFLDEIKPTEKHACPDTQ